MARTTEQERCALWAKRYRDSSDDQQAMRAAWERWYDQFYAVHRQQSAPWRSKVVDPKVASKAKAVIAKVALSSPEPNLVPNDANDFVKARNNEVLLMNDMRNPMLEQPLWFSRNSVVTDAAVTGTGLAMLPWTRKPTKTYSRFREGGKVSLSKEKVREETVGYNDFVPVSIFRVYLQPRSRSFYGSRYLIVEDFMDVEEAQEQGKARGWKNLKDIEPTSGSASAVRQFERSRNRLLTFTDAGDDQAHLWYCWDRITGEYCVYANSGNLEVYRGTNEYWHGKFPAVPFYLKPRAHAPWGEGLFEATERLGAANDSLINHFFDQLDLSLNQVMVRDAATTIVYQDMSPGGEVAYQGPKPEFTSVEQPDMQGFQIARQLLSEAIEENTISQYELGIPRSQTDQTRGTATGIQEIQEAAGDMVRYFETSYAEACKQWYLQWTSNNMQYMDRKRAVRILGPNGWFPKELSPEDIAAQGTLDVEVDTDAMRPRSKYAQRAETMAYIDKQLELWQLSNQAAQIAQQRGETEEPIKVNFMEMSRQLADAMGQKRFDRIVEPTSVTQDDPASENDLMLMGKEREPQPQEDHELHILVHTQELLADKGIDPEVRRNAEAHVKVHAFYLRQAEEQRQAEELMQFERMRDGTAAMAGMLTPQTLAGNMVPNAQPPGFPGAPQGAAPQAPPAPAVQAGVGGPAGRTPVAPGPGRGTF